MKKKTQVKDKSFNPSLRGTHNIYLLEPTDEGSKSIGYDCYLGQIIIADTEDEARKLCKIADEGNIWLDPKLITCEKIGLSMRDKGNVLASFNAG